MSSLLFLGFLLGVRHALEADHVATVAALASRVQGRKYILRQALAWGAGHSLTLTVFGVVLVSLGIRLSSWVAPSLEAFVGILMLLLGVDVILKASSSRIHAHSHRHDNGESHTHFHVHTKEQLDDHDAPTSHAHSHNIGIPLKGFLLGAVHGLAGTAALVLLATSNINGFIEALTYFCLFSLGSVIGMCLFSIVISVPLTIKGSWFGEHNESIQMSIGAMTIVLGGGLAVKSILTVI